MGIVPEFDFDIIISYAHLDNLKLADEDNGWVTDLDKTIHDRLWQELRHKPRIFRDVRDLDGRLADPTIAAAVRNSAVFLTVLSPAYMESRYCLDEAADFCGYRHPAFELNVRGFSRVVVAVYGETATEKLPHPLRIAPAVEFYKTDANGDRTQFNKPRRSDGDDYWGSINRVVRHLAAILREMQRGPTAGAEIAPSPGGVEALLPVYLAEATDDLQTERAEILQLLQRGSQRAGVEVGPERPILQGVSVRRSCQDGLARAGASVHLINATPGRIWGDAGKPLPQLELEIALQRPGKPRPLVWIPPGLRLESVANPEYREFLTSLKAGKFEVRAPEVRSPELFEMPFDRFAGQVESRLFPTPKAVWHDARKSQPGNILVYVSYKALPGKAQEKAPHNGQDDCPDDAHVERLIDKIRQRKHAVARLNHYSDKESEELVSRHNANLRFCDGLVILYRRDQTAWAEALTLETRILAGERRRPRRLGVAPQTCDDVAEFGIVDDLVMPIRIRQHDEFEGLDAFLDAIEGVGNG